MRRRVLPLLAIGLIVVGILGILAISILLTTQFGVAGGFRVPPEAATDPGVQNGARIYFTATDSAGRAIPYRGGMMMRLACANCHGPDGHGRATMMFVSPNITYANLTNPEGMLEPDGERMPPYDDATLKRAITQGIDSEGKPLDWPMPRWQMSEDDLNDLIAFLKVLK